MHDNESSGAADRGTVLHGIMEKHHVKAIASKEFKALTDEAEIAMIEKVVTYVTPIIKAAKGEVEYEVELDLTPYALPDTDFGTADILAKFLAKKHIDVIDYKFGWLEVDDAETNIQGWLYLLGALHRCPWAETVTVHFLQPRRDEITTHTFTRDQIPELWLRAQTIAARVQQRAGIDFNPVVGNCNWCANKAGCVALHAFVLRLEDKIPIEFPEEVKSFDPTVEPIDPKTAGELYDFADVIGKWAWTVKRHITDLADQGHEIVGHDLKSKRGNTSIVDPHLAVTTAIEKFGVKLDTIDDFLTVAEPSLHGLEGAIGALAPRGQKGAKKEEFRNELAKLGILEYGKPASWLERTT